MKDRIVVDVEIKKAIGKDGLTWDDTDKLGVSCAVVYEYKTDRFKVFGDRPDELQCLRERILKADRVVSFNGESFDFPVIWECPKRGVEVYIKPLYIKSTDILREIWGNLGLSLDQFTSAHAGWGLNAVCRMTLGRGKIGSGAGAPLLYKEGHIGELVTYCMDDVALTHDLDAFIRKYGYVVGKGQRHIEMEDYQ
jgi:DEAD/DEAH box helicase domain-containing protein